MQPMAEPHDQAHVVVDDQQAEPARRQAARRACASSVSVSRLVHAGRRLVEQQEGWIGGKRAGDLDAALVAVAELRRRDRPPSPTGRTRRAAPRPCSRAARRPSPCASAAASTFSTTVMLLNSRTIWNEREMPFSAICRGGRPGDRLLAQRHAAAGERHLPGDRVDQRRLARPVRADQPDDLAGPSASDTPLSAFSPDELDRHVDRVE